MVKQETDMAMHDWIEEKRRRCRRLYDSSRGDPTVREAIVNDRLSFLAELEQFVNGERDGASRTL